MFALEVSSVGGLPVHIAGIILDVLKSRNSVEFP